MLIIPTRSGGELLLAAYSFSQDELNAVEMVLKKSGIYPSVIAESKRWLDPRPGRLYRIQFDEAYKLEKLLQVRFVGAGRKTNVEDDVDKSSFREDEYHCARVLRSRIGKGCIDITAHNMDVAIVKCALMARK